MAAINKNITAAELGVPKVIPITNAKRYSYCDAHQAEFAGLEGEYVVYRGACSCAHEYQERVLLEDIKEKATIDVDGELTIGEDQGFVAEELQEL